MSELVTELKGIYEELTSVVESFNSPAITNPLDALEKSATEAEKSWSNSWLGYQSRVYYQGLEAARRSLQ